MERISLQARRDRLAPLAARVGPVAFARDRVLPVAPALESLFPEGGLVRGSIIGCQGATAVSTALAVLAAASAAGSWLAVVGVPALGLRAANEVGIALERLVMVAEPTDPGHKQPEHKQPEHKQPGEAPWANLVSALIDGFDLVLLRSSPRLRAGTARRLQSRVQARGGVLVIVGDPGQFGCDLVVSSPDGEWEGLGAGIGRLARRRLTLTAHGRRQPRARSVDLWLPAANGGIEAIETSSNAAAAELAEIVPITLERTG